MSRYLFAVWPFAGHVHPAIAIAHALQARGDEAAFYTGGSLQSLIEGEGFRFFPFVHVDENRVRALASSEFGFCPTLLSRLRKAKHIRDKFREWLLDTVPQQVLDLEAALTDWPADTIVCDLAFWSPFLILHEARKIPVAVLSILAACILPGPDAPTWGMGTPRPRGTVARLRGSVERTLVRWLSFSFRKNVDALRARYGLPALRFSVTEWAGQMPLYLVPSTPEYDYDRKDLPSSVRYVGPCLWDKPRQDTPAEWLSELPKTQPVIYVTEATIGTQEPFLLKAASLAFRDQPWQVVMTTGSQRALTDLNLGEPAPNIRVESYIPQSDLLPRTTVMVTLGGSGGVLAALSLGIPLVIVPTEWDRPENAQRVVEAGAGIRINPSQCTPERLRAAVQRVLTEPSFRENAKRLAASFASYGGPIQASELLTDLTTSTRQTRTSAQRHLVKNSDCMSKHNDVSLISGVSQDVGVESASTGRN